MADGIYTSPERVERDGKLIAFAGEVMTADEAVARGLVEDDAPAPAEDDAPAPAEAAAKTTHRKASPKGAVR